ncbi:MAG: ABC transporter permease [Bacillota bacterium]
MNRLLLLYAGEVTRMRKYGITLASLGVAVLWVLLLHFSELQDISGIFPLVLFVDTTLMSVLLVGVSMTFEKQENSIKSMLVLPISKDDYLLSKSLSTVTSSITTLLLLLVYGFLMKGLRVNIVGMFGAVLLVSFVFSQLGVLLTYSSKDFTSLLTSMFKFTLLLTIPTVLQFLKIFEADWFGYLQYLNPTKNALVLLLAPAIAVEAKDLLIAIIYLAVLGMLSFIAARRAFDGYAMKESGC